MKKTDYRVERDSIGVKDIPEDVYYGGKMGCAALGNLCVREK